MNFFNKLKTYFIRFLDLTLNNFSNKRVIKIILSLSPIYSWAVYPFDSILKVIRKSNHEYECSAVIIADRYIVIPGNCMKQFNKEEFIIQNSKYENIRLTGVDNVRKENLLSPTIQYHLVKVGIKFDIGDIIAFNQPKDYFLTSKITDEGDLNIQGSPFLWGKIEDKYFIREVKFLDDQYLKTTDDYTYVRWFMINNSDLSDGEGNLSGMSFSEIPTISREQADAYIRELINKKWFKTSSGVITTLPFKANKEAQWCCADKYTLVKIYNNTFKPNIALSRLDLFCKKRKGCLHILGHDYLDHRVYAYRDLQTHKIMIIDLAIDDRSFELNSSEMSIYLNKTYTTKDIVYVVSQDNFSQDNPSDDSWFTLINKIDTPVEEFERKYDLVRGHDNFK